MAYPVEISPDGRWFQVPGFCRQPTRGLVRPAIAAAWVGRPVEDLKLAGPEVRGPDGRVARFVGKHPSPLMRGVRGHWWQTDLEGFTPMDPAPMPRPWAHPAPLVSRSCPPNPPPNPPAEQPLPAEPEAEPLAAEQADPPAPEPEPEPMEDPAPPGPEPEPPAAEPEAQTEPEDLPEPAPVAAADPMPTGAAAPPSADALIRQGVAAIVEQLQAHGLLGGGDGLAVLPTEAVQIDPRRFQFRQISHHGDLRNVARWNPDLAGCLAVWRDPADGQVFVVDGHHRAGLARRLAVPALQVRFLEAATDAEARAVGAAVNIANGHASAFDVAKLLRDGGLPLSRWPPMACPLVAG